MNLPKVQISSINHDNGHSWQTNGIRAEFHENLIKSSSVDFFDAGILTAFGGVISSCVVRICCLQWRLNIGLLSRA